MYKIGAALADTNTTTVVHVKNFGKVWFGATSSNWNGASVAIQISYDGTNYVALVISGSAVALSANNNVMLEVAGGIWLRGLVSGSATALNVYVDGYAIDVSGHTY